MSRADSKLRREKGNEETDTHPNTTTLIFFASAVALFRCCVSIAIVFEKHQFKTRCISSYKARLSSGTWHFLLQDGRQHQG